MFSIALLTFYRLREPAFILLMIIGLVISYSFAGMGTFSSDVVSKDLLFVEAETQGTILLGSILITLLGSLIAVFNAAAEIPRDISSRMIAILLSKPISRFRYIWGKFFGTFAIGFVCSFIWLSAMLVSRSYLEVELSEMLGTGDILRQYACLLFLLPVTGISVAVSCYFSDVVAMIVTCTYLAFCFVAALVPVVVNLLPGEAIGKVMLIPYYLMPNPIYYYQSYHDVADYLGLGVYALTTAVIFMLLGRLRFDKGDIF